MIFSWLERISNEGHESEELAQKWHMAHVGVISIALVLNLCSVIWHWSAADRHKKAAERTIHGR